MESRNIKIPNILRAKVSVVGESHVGKTSLCHQLTSDGTDFPKNYLMTHGADLHCKSVNIPDTNDCVELYLMDCSGRLDMYGRQLEESWQDTVFVMAAYDVCREESFGAVAKWLEQVTRSVRQASGDADRKVSGVLLANKTDLSERRVVSPKLGSELAGQLGLMYFECSCKDYAGVEEPLYYLANEFHKMHGDRGKQMANIA